MEDFQTISNDLIKNLQLQYRPAGVSLYKESDLLPERTSFAEKELKSYCQAVVLAGEGDVRPFPNSEAGIGRTRVA